MCWGYGMGGGGWTMMLMMVFSSLIFLLLLAGLVVLGVLAFRALAHAGQGPGNATGGSVLPDDRALAILRERYARGELSSEQYEQMRTNLHS